MGRNLAIEQELFGCCHHLIQYRERSERMPALNQRFKSSCDYRMPASGRFARGTVLSCDHVGVLPHSTDFSHSLGSDRVNLGWHSTIVFTKSISTRQEYKVGDARLVNLSRVLGTFDPVATAPGSVMDGNSSFVSNSTNTVGPLRFISHHKSAAPYQALCFPAPDSHDDQSPQHRSPGTRDESASLSRFPP